MGRAAIRTLESFSEPISGGESLAVSEDQVKAAVHLDHGRVFEGGADERSVKRRLDFPILQIL